MRGRAEMEQTAPPLSKRPRGKLPRREYGKALGFLAHLVGHFTAVLSLPDLVKRVLDSLRDEFGFDSCTVALLDEHNPTVLTLVGGTGIRTGFLGLVIPQGQGLHWAVMEAKAPLYVPDMHADPRVFRREERIRSGIYAPLIVHNRPIGVLSVHRSRVDAFPASDLNLLTIVAGYLAGAFEVARLYEETGRRLHQLQALREIDIAITGSLDVRVTLNVLLEHVTSQLHVDAADVLLLNPHTHTLEYGTGRGFRSSAFTTMQLRLGEGLAGRAAVDRRVVSIPDLAKEPGGFDRSRLVAMEGFIAYHAVPLVAKGQVKGVLELFHRSPLRITHEWLLFLEALAGQAAIAIDNATLFAELQRSNVELALAYDTTLEGWSRALDLRDKETEGHTQRVTDLTLRLARAMGVPEPDLVHIRRGALLHDIGKMAISDSILNKPGPLTAEEQDIMRRHPVYAYELLYPIAYARPALDIPYSHHERWDGSGYPRGLRAEQIPLAARIFAVVDVWDALCHDRPYRPAWIEAKAQEWMREQSGRHFDPRVVDSFLQMQLQRDADDIPAVATPKRRPVR
jgi:putative nucleotidyltransferase with HDIG domain